MATVGTRRKVVPVFLSLTNYVQGAQLQAAAAVVLVATAEAVVVAAAVVVAKEEVVDAAIREMLDTVEERERTSYSQCHPGMPGKALFHVHSKYPWLESQRSLHAPNLRWSPTESGSECFLQVPTKQAAQSA